MRERKRSEAALAASEARYRALVRATSSLVWTTAADGQIVDMPEWRALTGQTVDEVQGWGWLNALHPDDRDRTQVVWQAAVETQSIYETEYRIRRWDGEYVWYQARGVAVLEDDRSIREWIGICVDIEERKRATQQQIEAEKTLRETVMTLEREQENKLMNVDAIMASIAHEVRQPLSAIATNGSAALRWLERIPPDYDHVRATLISLIRDSHRASEVFESIRALFRKTDQGRQPIDVNEITLEILQSLQGELTDHGVTAHTELASELPLIDGHKSQLQQVIVNLVHNAVEALDTTIDRSRTLRVRTNLHGRDAIAVLVEDSGPGIDPKQLKGIFDAFVTTKTKGMGLGLAICSQIIENHGGQLSASSDGKNGATFQFVLPINK
jgi:PAS domain S-box-containing protein